MKKNIETVTKLRTGDEVVVITGKDVGKKGTLAKISKLRTGDEVVVITGKDVGKKGTLAKISKYNNKAVVNGINMVKKHTKPNPQLGVTGGIVEQEAAIELSNIAIWNPKKKKADRISFLIENDKKVRVYSSDKSEIKS